MNDLKLLENEVVPVYTTDVNEKVVYGTELYLCIGSKRQYTDWIKERLNECDAIENEDFESFSQKNEKGGRPKTEYIIKLDTAKEMAMLERNEKGKEVRRYFIELEKKYKNNKISNSNKPTFDAVVNSLQCIFKTLKVNDAGKINMYQKLYKSYGIPTDFLPFYELNGNRELKSATELLNINNLAITSRTFNKKMLEAGFLEEDSRPKRDGSRKVFKKLTTKGLEFGENAINPHNNQEVQPLYYVDTFLKLYELLFK